MGLVGGEVRVGVQIGWLTRDVRNRRELNLVELIN
jgi:hypothetical protein